ncbi:MAG TPA: Holliday junction branch migration protein RuvA [Candidatus Methylomirabilis sp.]|nr:Holliday junction branch migration protein RuvA [Candidatus Methylomirabilis sp.]
MIGSLRGRVLALDSAKVLLDVNGVGFRVFAAPTTLTTLTMGEEVLLHVHDHVREDARDLYGFLTADELALFERLISISGVGPKAGMSILSVGSAETVKRAIMNGDLATLTSAPGVGTKIAQKIVLELKGQLVDVDVAMGPDREVVDALVSLGYSVHQARAALKGVSADVTDMSERVREALRSLSQ